MYWKPHIIRLTEGPAARAGKIDALFYPPLAEEIIAAWESEKGHKLPEEIRSYLLQSNGLEAQCGTIWPVLPFEQWEFIYDECTAPHPWLRFGETMDYRYLLSLGHSPSVYRHAIFGSDGEFFAGNFGDYLEKVYRNEA